MSDAPDRIIVSSHGLSYSVKATHTTAFKNVEYIRADLYDKQIAELKAWQEFVRYNSKDAAHYADEHAQESNDDL